jgi:uncharacterized protein YifN (PemK superfamily)
MAIKYSPKIGEILECDFGVFKDDATGTIDHKNYDGRIPPEMVKNRLVVVLNGKINNACVVVPISSSLDQDKVTRKWHVFIDPKLITTTAFWKPVDRWAKADHVIQVSRSRLSKACNSSIGNFLPRETITLIQEAVIRVIGGSSLLQASSPEKPETPSV